MENEGHTTVIAVCTLSIRFLHLARKVKMQLQPFNAPHGRAHPSIRQGLALLPGSSGSVRCLAQLRLDRGICLVRPGDPWQPRHTPRPRELSGRSKIFPLPKLDLPIIDENHKTIAPDRINTILFRCFFAGTVPPGPPFLR